VLDKYNNTIELTAGTPIALAYRLTNGSGLQATSVTVKRYTIGTMHVGWVAVHGRLYCKIGTGEWLTSADFVSSDLLYRKVINATWTIYLYTNRTETESGGTYTTTATCYWGISTHDSRIAGVQLENPRAYEVMQYEMEKRNYVGALMVPYLMALGPLFYGFIGIAIFYPIYRRSQSIIPVLIGFILLGGVGGAFLNKMIPDAGFNFGWLIAVFALAGLFLKAVWSLSHRD
jgi:hypothetical protein